MAIVQLVYLSRYKDMPASQYWYFNRNKPNEIKRYGDTLHEVNDRGRGADIWDQIPKAAWMSETMFPTADCELGVPIVVAIALAWSQQGPSPITHQPEARYWLMQPRLSLLLCVKDTLDRAKEQLSHYIANQTDF